MSDRATVDPDVAAPDLPAVNEPIGSRASSAQEGSDKLASVPSRVVSRRPAAADINPRRALRRRRLAERSLAIATPVALMVLWEVASRHNWIDSRFFPPPTRIWSTFLRLVDTGILQHDLLISGRRLALGFAIGCAAGIVGAVAVAMSRLARRALEPLVYALWSVPKLALLPLLFLIFGIGETPIVLLIAITCFFLVFIPTLAALLAAASTYRESAASFSATRLQVLRHISLPAAMPQIFVALRLTAGASILTLVAVEFLQSSDGIGFLIWNSWQLFQAEQMYVGILIVSVIGAIFSLLIAYLGRLTCPWWQDE